MNLDEQEVEKIAALARLGLTEKEKEKYAGEIGSILDYVGKLNEISAEGSEPTAQVTGLENVFRDDADLLAPGTESKKLITQFPNKKGSHLKVKPIFSER